MTKKNLPFHEKFISQPNDEKKLPASKISLFVSQMTKTPDSKKVALPLPNAEKNHQVAFGIFGVGGVGGGGKGQQHLVGVSRIFLNGLTLKCNGLWGVKKIWEEVGENGKEQICV